MSLYKRTKNKLIAKVLTRFPSLSKGIVDSYKPWEAEDLVWSKPIKPLNESKIAMVTTAGLHHKSQEPYDMNNKDGDPSFRELNLKKPISDLMITHDYYDHKNADKDINIVFPIERLRELADDSYLGTIADKHYGFMGHIDGALIANLIDITAPKVAKLLIKDKVDIVLLTPG